MQRVLAVIAIGTALVGCGSEPHESGGSSNGRDIAAAEAFIDAFYSFDASELALHLDHAEKSKPVILYYQGWAEGGNYKIMNRQPCRSVGADSIACPVTVDDDLINALGFSFDVTDTFNLTFSKGEIIAVDPTSDDPQEFSDAETWVRKHRPALIEVPCEGFFDGGPTPGACVKAMVQGFKEFASSNGGRKEDSEPAAT
jgi:hypothetical protein